MKIEYRVNQPLVFSGKALTSKVELVTGINDVDPELVRALTQNDYFNSLVEAEVIILKEALPELKVATEETEIATPKKTKKAIEFTEEP